MANLSHRWGTVAELLSHGRQNKAHKMQGLPFICQVQIKNIRNSDEWFTITCGGGQCMKGVTRNDGQTWCAGCENIVMFPRARFNIQFEVFDHTGEMVVVCFDDTARLLTKTTAQNILNAQSGITDIYSVYNTSIGDSFTPILITNANGSVTTIPKCLHSLVGTTQILQLDTTTYYYHGTFESFNCNGIIPTENKCYSIGSATPASMLNKGKGILAVPTPKKAKETMRQYMPTDEDSETESTANNNHAARKYKV